MAAQLEAIPPHDAKVMLRKYLEKHIGVIDKQRQDAKNLANLEVQLKEKQQALNEVERSCRLKELEFDRRYMLIVIGEAFWAKTWPVLLYIRCKRS